MSDIIASSREGAGRRRELLRVLRASADPMTIAAIADALGVHPNTVRFHLDSLLGDGQVEQVEPGRKGPGRPPLLFGAVRQMDRGGARHYRLLAEILVSAVAAGKDPRAKAAANAVSGILSMFTLSIDYGIGNTASGDIKVGNKLVLVPQLLRSIEIREKG